MEIKPRTLIIGAGPSGLTTIKSCKEEGLDVICFERSETYGGRWRYQADSTGVSTCVMKTTVSKFSKEMAAFSDFPPPEDFPNHMHHTKILRYLTLYAEKFGLLQHIVYQREVVKIVPSPQHAQNGKWLVTSVSHCTQTRTTDEFECVLVCAGRLSTPQIPNFPGQSTFEGLLMHSQSIKNAAPFENLTILVVGSGNSAVDVAVDLSTVAEQVYLSSRNGFWLFPKVGPKGLPFDSYVLRRNIDALKSACYPVANHFLEKYLQSKMDHDIFKIKPSYRALDEIPTVNDDLPDKILTGRVIVKNAVSKFEKHGVVFESEDHVTDFDCVIFATGYRVDLPFLEKTIYRDHSDSLKLYKRVFPVDLHPPTLGFIGFVESFGPILPQSELQSRWAARILSKKCHLPEVEQMRKSLTMLPKQDRRKNELMEDYMTYMDGIAEEIGVKPSISLLFKDATLFYAIFSGPFLPYQYRLLGPHSSSEARKFILNYEQRVKASFSARK